MSGPSATANPMSAKIAVSSSITWLIGCTRPLSAGVSRTGSVTSIVGREPRVESCALERIAALVQRAVHAIAQAVDGGALHLALVRRHGAQRLQQRGHRAALAQRRDADGLQRRLIGGGRDGLGD